jgi:hypothetical protein
VQVLKKCKSWNDLSYINYPFDGEDKVTDKRFLKIYRELISGLIKYVTEHVETAKQAVPEFKKQFRWIADYLERAIVPSTVMVDSVKTYPGPTVLINSGYLFKLEMLPKLLERIIGKNTDSVKDSSDLNERLELWILKALEDNRLLTGQVKNVSRS